MVLRGLAHRPAKGCAGMVGAVYPDEDSGHLCPYVLDPFEFVPIAALPAAHAEVRAEGPWPGGTQDLIQAND